MLGGLGFIVSLGNGESDHFLVSYLPFYRSSLQSSTQHPQRSSSPNSSPLLSSKPLLGLSTSFIYLHRSGYQRACYYIPLLTSQCRNDKLPKFPLVFIGHGTMYLKAIICRSSCLPRVETNLDVEEYFTKTTRKFNHQTNDSKTYSAPFPSFSDESLLIYLPFSSSALTYPLVSL